MRHFVLCRANSTAELIAEYQSKRLQRKASARAVLGDTISTKANAGLDAQKQSGRVEIEAYRIVVRAETICGPISFA